MTGSIARRRRRDAGQAAPLYIVAVGGLLFLAFALFAVGQAAATRTGAQTAADAAAVAAGQKYREQLSKGFLAAIGDGSAEGDQTAWEDLLNGRGIPSGAACRNAGWFAEQNDAEVSMCTPDSWPTSFAVTIKTRNTVGDSVIPGTESKHATANAKAVVVPRCSLAPAPPDEDKSGDAGKESEGGRNGKGEKGGKGQDDDPPPRELTCEGKNWTLDRDKPQDFPDASDLFAVRLAH
ncbi:pilus assembly protein TadG-related protein [Streptomyces sp. NPDC101227]|uniref:pilus assembly protein TadG-related protein n=1 Tax=Streptomyces sp. NPDC101227 TaxID=3366136 RepID=UPI00381B20FD